MNLIYELFNSMMELHFIQSPIFQGLVVSVFGAFIWELCIKPCKKWILVRKDKRSNNNVLNYKPAADFLVTLKTWSFFYPLKRQNHRVITDLTEKNQPYICQEKLAKEAEALKGSGVSGDICYLVGLQIDHDESEASKEFFLRITPCDYAEHIAANKLYNNCLTTKVKILEKIQNDPIGYLASPVPANIFVNVVVLSRNNFLAIKRSKSVDTAKGEWVPGPTETMTLKDNSPGNEENLFTLAERCLNEELNLNREMYGDIHFAWFGLSEKTLGAIAVAVVKIKDTITEGDIIDLAQDAHSSYESEEFEWMPYNKKEVKRHVNNESEEYMGKKWIHFTKLSLSEVLRFKSRLN